MKKILTREEREKKVKRNQLVIGILLIAIMVCGTLGYALTWGSDSEESQKIEHKGVEFIKSNEYWYFNIQGYDFMTKYNPQDIGDIYFLNYKTLQDYVQNPLYFVGNYPEPFYELGRNLEQFALRINDACLNEDDCSGDFPVKNCSEDNVIVIQEIDSAVEKESLSQDENCVFIKASLGNQTRYVDAYLFDLLGIR